MDGFNIFDSTHIKWLCSIMFMLILALFAYRKSQQKQYFLVFLFALLFLGEAAKQIYLLINNQYTYWSPPLHLCGLGIFICGWYALSPNRINATLLYSLTLPGALIALIFPGWTYEVVGGFIHIHSFFFHAILVLFVLCPLFQFELVLRVQDLWVSVVFLIVVVPLIYFYNLKFDTNFMFLNEPVENTPLEWLYLQFHSSGYLVSLSVLMIVIWCIQYGIYYVVRVVANKQKKEPE